MKRATWVLLAIVGAGTLLRSLRLDWQPLWWDEGYSVYFATEPVARMLWLTARDIHPPLYYALLHFWIGFIGGAQPEAARLLSVFLAALALPLQYGLARALFPYNRRPALLALLLLATSPIHLYYSQELRMYGLAVTLGLAASLLLWRFVQQFDAAEAPAVRTWNWALYAGAYLLTGLAALYTLYYAALLLVAHAVWAVIHLRRHARGLAALLGAYALMFLLYLPWLLYAVPQLMGYVGSKVLSDQDIPLGPLAYVERHLTAFSTGHVRLAALPAEWLALAPATFAICAIILGLVLRQTLRQRGQSKQATPAVSDGAAAADSAALSALWSWLLAPILLGWLINLRLPFFPAGGERLLLITLPYLLLLLAYGIDRTWAVLHLGKLAAAALAVNALIGISAFYTTPRYSADDYRPLLRQIIQQGDDQGTLLTIFPWQIGYWRAYTAGDNAGSAPGNTLPGPQPLLPADNAIVWSPSLQATIDAALEKGTVWFPEPLTFGSTLPPTIERYLGQHAVNMENRWYDATRLTAWNKLPPPAVQPVVADFGSVRLEAAGIAPTAAAAANQPIAATLVWQAAPPAAGSLSTSEVSVSLRLQDKDGYVWASREYARTLPAAGKALTETTGLLVPVGMPPGGYTLAVSVQTVDGEPLTIAGSNAVSTAIGELEVTQPQGSEMSALRLPIQHRIERTPQQEGLQLLGYSGPDADTSLLAGTQLAVTLFVANHSSEPPQSEIYLSLLDNQGAGVAGYAGWPLPDYPTATWPEGALVQVPASFYLPGALSSGSYRLVAGLRDPATGSETPPVELTTLAVQQRSAGFTRPSPQHSFSNPPQFGTHARLLGYDLATNSDQITIQLYWEVLQPLLPPHHIFVHRDAADGETQAQQDGPPATAAGPAPTGSWQPGEFLVTTHVLQGPAAPSDTIRVGLYDPQSQVRLPVTVDGQAAGDSVVLP